MPSFTDFSQVAVRIVEFQLAGLRIAGLLSVVVAALVATGVAASVLRLIREHWHEPQPNRRSHH